MMKNLAQSQARITFDEIIQRDADNIRGYLKKLLSGKVSKSKVNVAVGDEDNARQTDTK